MTVTRIEAVERRCNELSRKIQNIGGGGGGHENYGCWYGIRVSGQYYSMPCTCTMPTQLAFVPDTLRTHPFLVPTQQSFDRIAIECNAVAGAQIRLGIYDSTGAGYPNALLLDTGNLNSAGGGTIEAVIAITLEPELHFLAMVASHNQQFRKYGNADIINVLGHDSPAGVNPSNAYNTGHAFGALPNPFPGGVGTTDANNVLAIFLRKT